MNLCTYQHCSDIINLLTVLKWHIYSIRIIYNRLFINKVYNGKNYYIILIIVNNLLVFFLQFSLYK